MITQIWSTLQAVMAGFSFMLVIAFILYVVAITVRFRKLPDLTGGDASGYEWHIIIPCLNEASVISATLTDLTALTQNIHATLWVVDDASTDETRQIVLGYVNANVNVRLVARDLPDAQTGKSGALNAAYELINEQTRAANLNPETVIVGVVDADGRLDPTTFSVLAGTHCFATPTVGAVQQDVWMRNCDDQTPFPGQGKLKNKFGRGLLQLQDLEFRSSIAAIQNARHRTKSVSMGGNGQWTRLTALRDIAGSSNEPWKGSLLEDFELGLHLLQAGWGTRFTPKCWVSQEALPELKKLLKQRVRWTQGSMQCARYTPELWKNPNVSQSALLEISWYLIQPWLFIVGSFAYPLVYIQLIRTTILNPSQFANWVAGGGWFFLLMMVLTGIVPLATWGTTYRKRCLKPEGVTISRFRSIKLGVAYVAYVHLSYIIAWRALARLITGKSGWSKTARNNDPATLLPTETGPTTVGALA